MKLPLPAQHTLAVHTHELACAPDPLRLHRALTDDGERADTLLFETADAQDGTSARSLLVPRAAVRLEVRAGVATYEALTPVGERVIEVIAARDDIVSSARSATSLTAAFPRPPRDVDDRERVVAPSVFDAVRVLVGAAGVPHDTPALAVLCAGVFAYDVVDHFEDLPPAASDPLETPDVRLWLGEHVVVIDHDAGTTTIHELGDTSDIAPLVATIEAVAAKAAEPADSTHHEVDLHVHVDLDDETYAAQVTALQEAITDGEVFQVVPSRTFSAACPNPSAAYEALRALNPSPYMFHVVAGDQTLFGASPETAVKVTGRTLEVCPIAGTRPRGKTASGDIDVDLDDRMEAELRLDAKELAEHMMLVDLARNDVARVCQAGTRRVSQLLTVERYSHVMHLVSRVNGELRDELDALHAYQASMNMGTLTGAPKVRAAQLLRDCELTRRGAFGGAVGYVTHDGQMDSAIIIRSAVVKENVAHVRAGAGVVNDSVPLAEAEETRKKAGAVIAALRRSATEVTS